MPRAEVGTSKYVANRMKSKGLQRLRWYCQVCEKQCRDENGFKCHTQSESHVRQMQLVSQNPKSVIEDYSKDFLNDFIRLLRTAHNTKAVQINRFYQEYIANKEHIHMNATRWPSLTEFAKHLGREGICRVEETDKGLHIAWIDNSPEALRRQDAIRKRERMERGDEEREQRQIEDQIQRAHDEANVSTNQKGDANRLERSEGGKVTFTFGSKNEATSQSSGPSAPELASSRHISDDRERKEEPSKEHELTRSTTTQDTTSHPAKPFKMSLGSALIKPKNVFATAARKNALSGKASFGTSQPKKMSEAERIMKDEIERKRRAEERAFGESNRKQIRTT